jgi:hypothetical protein
VRSRSVVVLRVPWAALVYWKQNTLLGIIGHVGMQFVLWLGLTLVLFGGI